MVFLDEVREFLQKVEDFGRMSGGMLRNKYGADPTEGYEWLARQARELAGRIDKAKS